MNNYIDTHSHILFGIDDGSKNINMSMEMLKKLQELGFKEVILTPHYRHDFHPNNRIKEEVLQKLEEEKEKNNINIKLHLANELRICSNINELIHKDEIKLLGNYLFLELPFTTNIYNLNNVIYELQTKGITIILVHPERYSYLEKKDYEELLEKDILFQGNYESILGTYGRTSKKKIKYMLKNNMITFLGSDCHRPYSNFFIKFDKIKKKIIKIIGEEKFNDLAYNNIKKVLETTK